MKTEDIIKTLKSEFEKEIIKVEPLRERRVNFHVTTGSLVSIAKYLHFQLKFRFIIASAMHIKKGVEIYYHFSDDINGNIINLHVVLDEKKPEIDSLTGIFNAACWIEREMYEIMGINFLNHPNLKKLLSEGNWAEGVYPYRKTHEE